MVVRILKVRIDPKYRAEFERIEDEIAQFYVPENGCQYTRFFGDPETGWYGNVSVWENMDQINAALTPSKLAPILERAKAWVLEPPITEVYPVYEPKPLS
jgi:quinol monooxygenase YgiN